MWTVYGNIPVYNYGQHKPRMANEFQSLGIDIDIKQTLFNQCLCRKEDTIISTFLHKHF